MLEGKQDDTDGHVFVAAVGRCRVRIYRGGLTPTGCAEIRALKEQQTVNESRLEHLETGLLASPFNSLPMAHLNIHSQA